MNKEYLKTIRSAFSKDYKVLILLGIIIGLYLIYKFIFSAKTELSIVIAALPLCFATLLVTVKYYRRIFYLLFISHFLFLLINSYTDIMLGALTLVFNVIIIVLLALISIYKKRDWKNSWNGMLLLYAIWALYCIAELGNPNTVQYAWNIAITHYVVYPAICAILVPLTIRKYKNVQWLFILWSIFIILAAIKGYWQQTHGFNERELYFLFELGGAKTHIIWSGIRYFSYFTDAANFGVHMAMGSFAFGMLSIFTYNKKLRIYFLLVAAAAIYGMLISGTRSAIVIPLTGLIVFAFLSKNWKAFLFGLLSVVVIFAFFRFTTIGASNEYIRKMRTAFTPQNDASFNARLQNREKMKDYMNDMPFGYGLGLGGKGERFNPDKHIPVPPDSWLINVWVDTGTIGLVIYLTIHLILFAWCSWILMFKIMSKKLRQLLTIWLCVNAGFFVASYASDVMQYPNMIIIFTGFALCFAGPYIEKFDQSLQIEDIKIPLKK